MKNKILLNLSLILLLSACSTTSDLMVPPADVGGGVSPSNAQWAPYKSNNPPEVVSRAKAPTNNSGWQGNTAWGYPPAPSAPNSVNNNPGSLYRPSPSNDPMIVKPVTDTEMTLPKNTDVEKSALPDVVAPQQTATLPPPSQPARSTGVESASWRNIASSSASWVDKNVPASMHGAFGDAANRAVNEGNATVVDPETGNQYSMSRVWKVGKCSGIDVSLLSPGGKLPVISRGTTEICS